jgi:FAD/FMN-containing dehydrogenase
MEGVSKQHVVDSLEDSVWPDPHPLCEVKRGHGVLVNDVSRMSSFKGTSIDKIFFPRTEKDVVRVLSDTLRTGRPVCMRGTKHSMGGQTIAPSGHMLDMKCMNAMRYDEKTDTVTCGPGCLWSDLIVFLNPFGKSPRTMQSYCTFSVGGSLSVNAHGITTDYCFADQSLLSVSLT